MKRNVQKPGVTRPSTARGMRLGIVAVVIGLVGSAFASTVPNETAAATTTAASTSAKRSRFAALIGKASWYGGKFNGRRTASGEKFDMNLFTCAHRTLPLGSWVKVTNLHNKKSVFARVNDRGPVPENVMLDLSYAAARKLGIGGLGKVKVEPVRAEDAAIANAIVRQVKPQLLEFASTANGIPILPTFIAAR